MYETSHNPVDKEDVSMLPGNSYPTLEQFGRLDERIAGALKVIGSKMDDLSKQFTDHIEEDREMRVALNDQQRQLDRIVMSLESINRQLIDFSGTFRKGQETSGTAIALVRNDVDELKKFRLLREHDEEAVAAARIRRDANTKVWIAAFSAVSGIIAIVVSHFWR